MSKQDQGGGEQQSRPSNRVQRDDPSNPRAKNSPPISQPQAESKARVWLNPRALKKTPISAQKETPRAEKQNDYSTMTESPGVAPGAEKMQKCVSAPPPTEGVEKVPDAQGEGRNENEENKDDFDPELGIKKGGPMVDTMYKVAERLEQGPDADEPSDESTPKDSSAAEDEKSKRGRPRVLDGYGKARVAALVAAGLSQRTAADYLNIHPSTISKALKRDKSFRKELTHAVAAAKLGPMMKIVKAAESNWRAAAWLYQNAQPKTDLTEKAEKKRRRREKKRFERETQRFVDGMRSPREQLAQEGLMTTDDD